MSYSLGQKTLLRAVISEKPSKIKQLFKPDYLTGSNGDEFGFTLLMAAIERNHKDIVVFLLDKDCRVTRPNKEIIIYDTPLHWPVRNGYLSILVQLLAKGASVHEKGLGQENVIYEASKKKKSTMADKLLESYDFHQSSPNNPDALLYFLIACQRCCEKVLQKFVLLGFPIDIYLDMEDEKRGYRPLHYAVAKQSFSIVELLLRKNADVNIKSELGFTPLHLACELGKKHMIQLLLHNKADPSIQNNEGQTPFHLAFYKKQYVVSLLQTHISKNINLIDSRGLSYFHILCTTHSHTAIVALLQSGAATVDMCVVDDKGAFSGYSALHFAVEFNRENIVELLLQHNANVNYCPSLRKITPLHLACMHRDVKYHELPDPEELNLIL